MNDEVHRLILGSMVSNKKYRVCFTFIHFSFKKEAPCMFQESSCFHSEVNSRIIPKTLRESYYLTYLRCKDSKRIFEIKTGLSCVRSWRRRILYSFCEICTDFHIKKFEVYFFKNSGCDHNTFHSYQRLNNKYPLPSFNRTYPIYFTLNCS